MRLRRLHIAGSANPTASDPALIRWTQHLVARVVAEHAAAGGTVVVQIGADPVHGYDPAVRTLFDWTVMEACLASLRAGKANPRPDGEPLVRAVALGTGRAAVSGSNEETLSALREVGALDITTLPEHWRFGAVARQGQASLGEVLMTIGGGVGVEHLAQLYAERRNPILPLDIPLGSYFDDSPRGGAWLASEAQSNPGRFLDVEGPVTAGAHLDGLRVSGRRPPLETMVDRVTALLRALGPKRAFFVRLLDGASPSFADVEWFFRSVVDAVVEARGLQRVEVGTDPQRQGFMNAEIFTELHFASAVIADMTDRRPNCAVELGYALARGHPVILTARAGEAPPFDIDKLPFHFWTPGGDVRQARRSLSEYWDRQAGRAPVVARASAG